MEHTEFPPLVPSEDIPAQSPLMTTREACDRLRVHARTLRAMHQRGLVDGFRLSTSPRGRWRWLRTSVERFADGTVVLSPQPASAARRGGKR